MIKSQSAFLGVEIHFCKELDFDTTYSNVQLANMPLPSCMNTRIKQPNCDLHVLVLGELVEHPGK